MAEKNKLQLHQLGERLARASHPSKAGEIQNKLTKVNDRWQHLLDLIGARLGDARDTFIGIVQLDFQSPEGGVSTLLPAG